MRDTTRLQDLSPVEQDWIDAYVDGTIEPEAFEALQNQMLEKPTLRAVMRRYLALDNSLQNEGEASLESLSQTGGNAWLEAQSASDSPTGLSPQPRKIATFLLPVAFAASLAFFLGLGLIYWQTESGNRSPHGIAGSGNSESLAEGFAVIGKLFDVEWKDPGVVHREGDTLGSEVIRLASGTAEIQFFSGATMTIEGPAEISVQSAWEASCKEGSVRMQVPPAARGFKLQAPSTEIVDLGTEFGLIVRDGKGHVEVLDGEIALTHQNEDEKILIKGNALNLPENGTTLPAKSGETAFPDVTRFGSRAKEELRADFDQWQKHRERLSWDKRIIAYYVFDRNPGNTLIPNLTVPRNPEFDGSIVMAEPVDGRWPGFKSALEFHRPGSRVRVNIPGEFSAFTFACWVRIDSLDRQYNALFMGDGYETGEPHWQIRNDGSMMLSVMVDDTKPNPGAPNDAGFHRVYYSPPMWDLSMSGQWLHLASVFDPTGRTVSHYVNGREISSQEIEDRFLIQTLRIGNAEIGNWGLPFRQDPWFAIRNLNGRMDELAIFRAALSPEEIADLFETSRAGRKP